MEDLDVFEAGAQVLRCGQRAVLATVVRTEGSTPRDAGAKLLFREDGTTVGTVGGGVLESRVLDRCREILDSHRSERMSLDITEQGPLDAACGGVVEVFLDPLGPKHRLIVAGAGHVGMAVARLAWDTGGFKIVVVDDREDSAALEPSFCEVVRHDMASFLKGLHLGPQDGVVIVTRGHRLDEEALASVIGRGAGYVGMIGSRSKVKGMMDRLKAKGVPEEELDRVYSPIGFDIGAETPSELALSILAEVMAVLNARAGEHCRKRRS